MENSNKAVAEVVLDEEQLQAVVGGASRFVRDTSPALALYAQAFVVPADVSARLQQLGSAFGDVQVTRLDRGSLLMDVVAN